MNEIDQYLERLNLTYSVRFVPKKYSRNKAEKNLSLNWVVTISNGNNSIETDYMQGIGHVPKLLDKNTDYNTRRMSRSMEHVARDKLASEEGTYYKSIDSYLPFKIPPPGLKDVLYALLSDSSVYDYHDFEDWADECGYDSDSIKALELYNTCLKTAKQFSKIVDIPEMRVVFQDY